MRDFLLQFGPEQQHYMGYPVKGVSQCRDPTSPTQQENTGQVFDLAQMISQRQPADDPDKSTNQPQSIRKLLHKLRSVSPQQPGDHAHIPNQSKQDTAQQSPPAHKQQHTNTQQVHTSHSTDLTTQSRPQARASPQHGNQQMYALSGTGMILSRGAMAHFAPQLRGCMLASQDCHLDDVRLFLCLKEAGISLNTTSGYAALNLAPNRHLDWGMFDPCTQPAVFHGVSLCTLFFAGQACVFWCLWWLLLMTMSHQCIARMFCCKQYHTACFAF